MRSDPADYRFVAPGNLQEVMSLLAEQPGEWLAIAGGTDVMVQYAAGKLAGRKLVSIWNLPELQGVRVLAEEIRVGAGSTYTEIRKHEIVGREFPLLARAASWTGGIANQNRGTLGGNIVNASPAADSLPALLAYDAELILVSVRGERRVPYVGFHSGYKKMDMAPDELIRAICIPRVSSDYFQYTRKVGARKAQAISKVCVAALGKVRAGTNGKVIAEVRVALGSVAPIPLRLTELERAVQGKAIDAELLQLARRNTMAAIQPIDDIRSTAKYRSVVAGNLVAEFFEQLRMPTHPRGTRMCGAPGLVDVLARWNVVDAATAANEILPCCGSRAWAAAMAVRRPLAAEAEVLETSDEIWRSLTALDWMEAFRSHPRIGESDNREARELDAKSVKAAEWSEQEQRKVADADASTKLTLADGNREYERRFNRIFIVCAMGKSPEEILSILNRRLNNDEASELQEAWEQQRQITHLRLRKWLQSR
jgi:OHCU decarboxylase